MGTETNSDSVKLYVNGEQTEFKGIPNLEPGGMPEGGSLWMDFFNPPEVTFTAKLILPKNRKRFVKLLMANKHSRNKANEIAKFFQKERISYKHAYVACGVFFGN